jgi:hypothetical protein
MLKLMNFTFKMQCIPQCSLNFIIGMMIILQAHKRGWIEKYAFFKVCWKVCANSEHLRTFSISFLVIRWTFWGKGRSTISGIPDYVPWCVFSFHSANHCHFCRYICLKTGIKTPSLAGIEWRFIQIFFQMNVKNRAFPVFLFTCNLLDEPWLPLIPIVISEFTFMDIEEWGFH